MTEADKEKLLSRKWNDFERYPKKDEHIMLHVIGHIVRGNKNLHDFIPMVFNAKKFNPNEYIKVKTGITWSFSWLPLKEALTGSQLPTS